MGTNFYVKGHRGDDDPRYYIGKRRAAGPYCWDCGVTLCKEGVVGIHSSHSHWHDRCPQCGQRLSREAISESAFGREMGFAEFPPAKKSGVRSCSSFSWARKLGRVQKIVDEYGREYTRDEFLKMLEECPIRYTDMCGERFS